MYSNLYCSHSNPKIYSSSQAFLFQDIPSQALPWSKPSVSMSQQNIQELITSAQHHHEEYIRGLRILRDSLPVTRDRADSRSSAVVPTSPPLRAQTFASDSVNLNNLRGRPRRDTLEAPERPRFAPSPQPSRVTISNHDGDYLPVNDDEFCFIPLLDPASPRATFQDVGPRATKRITPMSF